MCECKSVVKSDLVALFCSAGAMTWKARRNIKDLHPAWAGSPQIWVPVEEDQWAQKYSKIKNDALFSTKVVEKEVATSNEP